MILLKFAFLSDSPGRTKFAIVLMTGICLSADQASRDKLQPETRAGRELSRSTRSGWGGSLDQVQPLLPNVYRRRSIYQRWYSRFRQEKADCGVHYLVPQVLWSLMPFSTLCQA